MMLIEFENIRKKLKTILEEGRSNRNRIDCGLEDKINSLPLGSENIVKVYQQIGIRINDC